jgi:hypothetical protein
MTNRAGYKLTAVLGLVLLCSGAVWAGELAVLRNGFTIRHTRHEQRDDVTRLYLTAEANNFVDVPTGDIERFEEVEEPPVVPIEPPATAVMALDAGRPMALDEMVHAASDRNKLDRDLVLSVIRVESGFNPRAISHKGAQGLMQLMPQTAAHLGVADPLDPSANVEGGTRYLRELLARYNNNLVIALAAYNAGPESVDQYHGVPPFPETRIYVQRIIHEFNCRKAGRNRSEGKNGCGARMENPVSTPPMFGFSDPKSSGNRHGPKTVPAVSAHATSNSSS